MPAGCSRPAALLPNALDIMIGTRRGPRNTGWMWAGAPGARTSSAGPQARSVPGTTFRNPFYHAGFPAERLTSDRQSVYLRRTGSCRSDTPGSTHALELGRQPVGPSRRLGEAVAAARCEPQDQIRRRR